MAITVRFKLVGGEFLDTFKDESVNYVQKIQDFSLIDKSFTDFSLTFSIPATLNNLSQLGFYNDPALVDGFDPKAELPMEMFVNQEKFSTGTLKMISMGRIGRDARTFKIQYFADATNLAQALQVSGVALKIGDLNWQSLNHQLTKATLTDYLRGQPVLATGLKYPMLSQDNVWRWDGPTVSDDGFRRIAASAPPSNNVLDRGILDTEVRPSILVSEIMDAIFAKATENNSAITGYTINFDIEPYYANLWMWISNGKSFLNVVLTSQALYATNGPIVLQQGFTIPQFSAIQRDDLICYDIGTQLYTVQIDGTYFFNVTAESSTGNINDIEYRYNRIGVGVSAWVVADGTNPLSLIGLTAGDEFRIEMRGDLPANQGVTMDSGALMDIYGPNSQPADMIINSYMPDVTCIDFILGILRTFNAVMYWDADTKKFIIDHKTNWFFDGKEVDITDDVDTTNDEVLPPAFFRTYEIGWAEAQDYLNTQYIKQFVTPVPWGTELYSTEYKYGTDYKVINIFTASIWQEVLSIDDLGNVSKSGIPSFQCVNPEGDSVDAGVRLMYFNGIGVATADYWTADANGPTTGPTFSDFNKFSFVEETTGMLYSYSGQEDWAIDTSPIPVPQPVSKTLYTQFYRDYLIPIYLGSTRRYKFRTWLPYNKIKDIKMNDTLVIQGKKYYINEMRTNYLTGQVDFELIDWLDFQPVATT